MRNEVTATAIMAEAAGPASIPVGTVVNLNNLSICQVLVEYASKSFYLEITTAYIFCHSLPDSPTGLVRHGSCGLGVRGLHMAS